MTEKDYRRELKGRLIKYRNSLNLPKDITFGVEIEYENMANELVTFFLNEQYYYNPNFKNWINKTEIDICVYNSYREIINGEVNSPILRDEISSWKNLKTALDILNRNNAIVTNWCGGHVNIGAHILGYNLEYWRNFLLLWMLYEKEIYQFSSGEYLKIRNRGNCVIERITPTLLNKINIILKNNIYKDNIFDYLYDVSKELFDKTHDISLEKFSRKLYAENNRIEFRVPNVTIHEEIWQNYINFFAKFLLACKKELDVEKTIYKIKNNDHSAIELADYVFEDDIDKENFLIQTLKTNKVYEKQLPIHIERY